MESESEPEELKKSDEEPKTKEVKKEDHPGEKKAINKKNVEKAQVEDMDSKNEKVKLVKKTSKTVAPKKQAE
jgi:hypothetical protein